MASDIQHCTNATATPVVTATSIAELLNFHVTTKASINNNNNINTANCNMAAAISTKNGADSTPSTSNFHDVKPTQQQLNSLVYNNASVNIRMNGSNGGMAQTPPYSGHYSAGAGPIRGKTDPSMAPYICAKCNSKIVDRYLLEALDKYWHEDCLKCDACDGRLGELGSKLYFKNNSILCQRDYLRIFRPGGTCAACTKAIPAFEQVMRAGSNVYHLECFACQECNHRFCIGDRFYLDVDHNKILCEIDFEERMVFARAANNPNWSAQLKRQISQQIEDFDEVQSVPR